jgi:hypothetical protein
MLRQLARGIVRPVPAPISASPKAGESARVPSAVVPRAAAHRDAARKCVDGVVRVAEDEAAAAAALPGAVPLPWPERGVPGAEVLVELWDEDGACSTAVPSVGGLQHRGTLSRGARASGELQKLSAPRTFWGLNGKLRQQAGAPLRSRPPPPILRHGLGSTAVGVEVVGEADYPLVVWAVLPAHAVDLSPEVGELPHPSRPAPLPRATVLAVPTPRGARASLPQPHGRRPPGLRRGKVASGDAAAAHRSRSMSVSGSARRLPGAPGGSR